MDMHQYARGSRLILKLLRLLSRRTGLVLCNSAAGRIAHERLGYRSSRWRVIPNGLDVDLFRPRLDERVAVRDELGLNDYDFVVGMCARVDPMKDHATFVKAAAVFAGAAPEARFVLIGAGADEPGSTLDRAVATAGLAGRFVRLGRRWGISRLHAAQNIATLSSAFGEGSPNVLVEAITCGVPCVATDVGDSASIVSDTGVIVPPRDPKALAAAWNRLRRGGSDGLARRGTSARRRVECNYALSTGDRILSRGL